MRKVLHGDTVEPRDVDDPAEHRKEAVAGALP